jgi:hypothetical protein
MKRFNQPAFTTFPCIQAFVSSLASPNRLQSTTLNSNALRYTPTMLKTWLPRKEGIVQDAGSAVRQHTSQQNTAAHLSQGLQKLFTSDCQSYIKEK